jgi:hypothetical protein
MTKPFIDLLNNKSQINLKDFMPDRFISLYESAEWIMTKFQDMGICILKYGYHFPKGSSTPIFTILGSKHKNTFLITNLNNAYWTIAGFKSFYYPFMILEVIEKIVNASPYPISETELQAMKDKENFNQYFMQLREIAFNTPLGTGLHVPHDEKQNVICFASAGDRIEVECFENGDLQFRKEDGSESFRTNWTGGSVIFHQAMLGDVNIFKDMPF